MLAAGLRVTLNSDGPAHFGGYLGENVTAVRQELGLDDKQFAALAHNSFDACFASAADKLRWKSEVDAALGARPRPAGPSTVYSEAIARDTALSVSPIAGGYLG